MHCGYGFTWSSTRSWFPRRISNHVQPVSESFWIASRWVRHDIQKSLNRYYKRYGRIEWKWWNWWIDREFHVSDELELIDLCLLLRLLHCCWLVFFQLPFCYLIFAVTFFVYIVLFAPISPNCFLCFYSFIVQGNPSYFLVFWFFGCGLLTSFVAHPSVSRRTGISIRSPHPCISQGIW